MKTKRQLLTAVLLLNFLLISIYCFPQGAAINTTGATAHPSAMLDISSDNSGILIPRMTKSQKLLIPTPATGLMIYQTDDTTGFGIITEMSGYNQLVLQELLVQQVLMEQLDLLELQFHAHLQTQGKL